MRMFAIGLTKNWIEVRSALEPPKTVRNQVVRVVTFPKTMYNPKTGTPGGKADLVLESVFHVGGKFVTVLPRTRFLNLAKGSIIPKTGEMTELPQHLVKSFASAFWRKMNRA